MASVKVKKRIKGRLKEWGNAYFIGNVALPKSQVEILKKEYIPDFGEILDVEISEWLTKKPEYHPLFLRELDENNKLINQQKLKQ
tara:strand:+ start:186 stop:440 length:255 start_codon:yes stop_codon:yes gene_type:complete